MFLLFAADKTSVIQIGLPESIIGSLVIVLSAGIAWGALRQSVQHIDKDVEEIKKDFKKMNREFITVKTLVESQAQSKYAQASSPKRLTPTGLKVLQESGIQQVVDKHKESLINSVQERAPTNAYDVEVYSVQAVKKLVECNEEILNLVKDKTFELGETLDIVLFVGGLYLRDSVLPEFGYSLDDVDKHDPKRNKKRPQKTNN